jgi:hypothetical protein
VVVEKRKPIIVGAVALIPLNQGMCALIDSDDLPKLEKFGNWRLLKSKNGVFYAKATKNAGKRRIGFKLHRVLLGITDPKIYVDHKDRDGLNNLRSNLRPCTHAQNNANRVSPKGLTAYKGIRKLTGTPRWKGLINLGGKQFNLGVFNTKEEAALAYNKAALEAHGEFARLNEVAA